MIKRVVALFFRPVLVALPYSFTRHQWYREAIGGNWYLIRPTSLGHFGGGCWVTNCPDNDRILVLKEEHYE